MNYTHGSSLLEANQEVIIGQKGGLSGTEHPGNSAGSAPVPKGSLSEEVEHGFSTEQLQQVGAKSSQERWMGPAASVITASAVSESKVQCPR